MGRVYRKLLRKFLLLRQHHHIADTGFPGIPYREVSGYKGCVVRLALSGLRSVRSHRVRRGVCSNPCDEDRGELDGLLRDEYGQSDDLAAHIPGGEVQGEADGGYVPRPHRRCALCRVRACGHYGLSARPQGLRGCQSPADRDLGGDHGASAAGVPPNRHDTDLGHGCTDSEVRGEVRIARILSRRDERVCC